MFLFILIGVKRAGDDRLRSNLFVGTEYKDVESYLKNFEDKDSFDYFNVQKWNLDTGNQIGVGLIK